MHCFFFVFVGESVVITLSHLYSWNWSGNQQSISDQPHHCKDSEVRVIDHLFILLNFFCISQAALGAEENVYDQYATFKLFESFPDVCRFNVVSILFALFCSWVLLCISACCYHWKQGDVKAAFDGLKSKFFIKQNVRNYCYLGLPYLTWVLPFLLSSDQLEAFPDTEDHWKPSRMAWVQSMSSSLKWLSCAAGLWFHCSLFSSFYSKLEQYYPTNFFQEMADFRERLEHQSSPLSGDTGIQFAKPEAEFDVVNVDDEKKMSSTGTSRMSLDTNTEDVSASIAATPLGGNGPIRFESEALNGGNVAALMDLLFSERRLVSDISD